MRSTDSQPDGPAGVFLGGSVQGGQVCGLVGGGTTASVRVVPAAQPLLVA
ncbi:hypothetical protein ITI46_09165 [Streptomyces oryzae]|uniref:Uncharacterized protein n=1 Tax=Streptomyces oryzae TaxID=1434886 RepID=A0ABS3X8Z3_9ACTN|nr:hypothetical protein [Streptomyces oryzae]MBO8191843.1 hypothetical protein [Streptomyces oryzae]